MKIRIIRLTDNVTPYIEIPNSVCTLLGWDQDEDLDFEPVVDKQGRVTHVVLEKK